MTVSITDSMKSTVFAGDSDNLVALYIVKDGLTDVVVHFVLIIED